MRNKKVYYKYAAYVLLAMVIFVLQYTRGISLEIYGIKPEFFIMFVVALAMLEGAAEGAALGFFAALLVSVSEGGMPLGNLLFYPLLGGVFGTIMEIDFRKHLVSAELFTCLGAILYNVLAYLVKGALIGEHIDVFIKSTAVYVLLAGAAGVPVYFAVKRIYDVFTEEEV